MLLLAPTLSDEKGTEPQDERAHIRHSAARVQEHTRRVSRTNTHISTFVFFAYIITPDQVFSMERIDLDTTEDIALKYID